MFNKIFKSNQIETFIFPINGRKPKLVHWLSYSQPVIKLLAKGIQKDQAHFMKCFIQISLVLKHRTISSYTVLQSCHTMVMIGIQSTGSSPLISLTLKQLIRKRKTTKNTQQCFNWALRRAPVTGEQPDWSRTRAQWHVNNVSPLTVIKSIW